MPTRLAHFAQVRLGDREPADPDLAGAATEDAVEVEDERGLAGAVRAEESDSFALVDGEVDSEERAVPIGVRERDAADVERGDVERRGAHASTHATVAMTAPTAGSASATSHWSAGAEWSSTIGIVPS